MSSVLRKWTLAGWIATTTAIGLTSTASGAGTLGERLASLRPAANKEAKDGREAREAADATADEPSDSNRSASLLPGRSSTDGRIARRLSARKKPESTQPVVSPESDDIQIPGVDEADGEPPAPAPAKRSNRATARLR